MLIDIFFKGPKGSCFCASLAKARGWFSSIPIFFENFSGPDQKSINININTIKTKIKTHLRPLEDSHIIISFFSAYISSETLSQVFFSTKDESPAGPLTTATATALAEASKHQSDKADKKAGSCTVVCRKHLPSPPLPHKKPEKKAQSHLI